jgi:hypothetical protein
MYVDGLAIVPFGLGDKIASLQSASYLLVEDDEPLCEEEGLYG